MPAETDKKFASIPHWSEISDMNRSAIYAALGRGDLCAMKLGRRVLIDVEAGLAWLKSLPKPQTRAPKQAAA